MNGSSSLSWRNWKQMQNQPDFPATRLVLVGHLSPVHMGAHLKRAAEVLNISTTALDSAEASGGSFARHWGWRVLGHQPGRLHPFSREVVRICRQVRPEHLLAVGLAPIDEAALKEIGRLGIRRINYSTDDPWNPAHRSVWFMRALKNYDAVFSTRRANLEELRRVHGSAVSYLPFGYAPEIHFPEPLSGPEDRARFSCDVAFIGGADRDRIPWIRTLIRARFRVALYGPYWNRFYGARPFLKGYADPPTMRKAVSGAKVTLCLVRRANRDGHSMRSFEVPAMGGCMLAEDTQEHREILGEEGRAAVYFQTPEHMVEKLRWLLAREDLRRRLAAEAHRLITAGANTYRDRLETMLA